MIIKNFGELYKLYQSVLLLTFEETIKENGWKITKRNYRLNYSKDLTTLELSINGNGIKEGGFFYFNNSWKEVLYIDRDESPLRVDPNIINKEYGIAKATRIAIEKAEAIDAFLKNDKDKMHALGKLLGRINAPSPIDPQDPSKGSIRIHYENGLEQPDSGSFVPMKEKYE